MPDLYLRASKSFVRDLCDIGHLQTTAEMIKRLRNELSDDEISLSIFTILKQNASRNLKHQG